LAAPRAILRCFTVWAAVATLVYRPLALLAAVIKFHARPSEWVSRGTRWGRFALGGHPIADETTTGRDFLAHVALAIDVSHGDGVQLRALWFAQWLGVR
jgi:hypothetical protein